MSGKNVLAMKLAAIGDVAMTLPALTALKQADPGARVTLLIGQSAAPLADNNPAIDERIVVDENIFWRKKYAPLMRLFFQLKRRNFDAVYIMHWSRWFHVFFWLMGIPERIGFNREGLSFRLTRALPYMEGSADIHETQQYLRLVDERYGSTNPTANPPHLFFSATEMGNMDDLIARMGFPKDLSWIAMAPGGGHNAKLFMPQKRWPAANYAELTKRLVNEEGAYVILLGDASEKDLLNSWLDQIPADHRCNLAGELSLRQTALLIQKCRLFIGNDSGLMHLAGTVGTPSLSFFGPTSPNGKLPVWTTYKYLYTHESCSPCYKYGQAPPCPYDLKCMHHISVDQAFAATHDLLHSRTSLHAS